MNDIRLINKLDDVYQMMAGVSDGVYNNGERLDSIDKDVKVLKKDVDILKKDMVDVKSHLSKLDQKVDFNRIGIARIDEKLERYSNEYRNELDEFHVRLNRLEIPGHKQR